MVTTSTSTVVLCSGTVKQRNCPIDAERLSNTIAFMSPCARNEPARHFSTGWFRRYGTYQYGTQSSDVYPEMRLCSSSATSDQAADNGVRLATIESALHLP